MCSHDHSAYENVFGCEGGYLNKIMSVCLSLQAKEILTKESNVQEVRFCTMADKKPAVLTSCTTCIVELEIDGWMDI